MVKNNVYVGQRYVPKIMGEWDQSKEYEGLSIVTIEGDSFTSKKQVPAGVDINNSDYWVATGIYDAQVAKYRQDVLTYKEESDQKIDRTNKVIDQYISPENFTTLQEAVNFARENKKIIKADKVFLTANVSFRGVGIDIKQLTTNGFSVELGDFNEATDEIPTGTKVPRPVQSILSIYGTRSAKNEVFIRGACYQTINIGHYNGFIQFRMNDTVGSGVYEGTYPNRFIAYNQFNFTDVMGIEIENDQNAGLSGQALWCSENDYFLNNTMYFRLGKKGQYSHGLNRIHAGVFEGDTCYIDIQSGDNNTFRDIRGEGKLTITFEEGTRYNKVEMGHYLYTPVVIDRGYANSVTGMTEKNIRLVQQDKINSGHLIDGDIGFLNTTIHPFSNIEYDRPLKAFKKDSTEGAGNVFWESAFIDNPQNARLLLESHLQSGLGFGVGYKYYDKDYNDITSVLSSEGFTAYIISTTESALKTSAEGAYRGPSNGLTLYANTITSESGVKNDVISLVPGAHWKTKITENTKKIKYVKFFAGHAGELSELNPENPLRFYDLKISIYDIGNNYKRKYFQNYITV